MFTGERILLTGSAGFLGQHVVARLQGADVASCSGRQHYDLRKRLDVIDLFERVKPTVVVHLAYPGGNGIATSVHTPFTLAHDQLQMDLHVIERCVATGVKKLLCVGSACAYPEHTTLPTDESQLWAGYPESVNAAYGVAKRTQLMLLQAARQQAGLNGIHLILGNLYGPGDRSGHVIPATINKVRRVLGSQEPIVVWGRPEVTRSFLYVDDAAEGIVRALQSYDQPEPLNVCSPEEVSMERLALLVRQSLGGTNPITYDTTQPTGHLRRQFDIHQLQSRLRWKPSTAFVSGLTKTIAWTLTDHPDPFTPRSHR